MIAGVPYGWYVGCAEGGSMGIFFLNGVLLGYLDGIFMGWVNGFELGEPDGGFLGNSKWTPTG